MVDLQNILMQQVSQLFRGSKVSSSWKGARFSVDQLANKSKDNRSGELLLMIPGCWLKTCTSEKGVFSKKSPIAHSK